MCLNNLACSFNSFLEAEMCFKNASSAKNCASTVSCANSVVSDFASFLRKIGIPCVEQKIVANSFGRLNNENRPEVRSLQCIEST